jgi:hypothetical protein
MSTLAGCGYEIPCSVVTGGPVPRDRRISRTHSCGLFMYFERHFMANIRPRSEAECSHSSAMELRHFLTAVSLIIPLYVSKSATPYYSQNVKMYSTLKSNMKINEMRPF